MVTNLDYKNTIEGDSNQLIFNYF